jgi:membrane protein YdbS with pleckstrin-like domain
MTPATTGKATRRGRPGRTTIILVVAGALAVAAHLGLGGTALAGSPWSGWAVAAMAAIVVLKVAVIGVSHFRLRHRMAAKKPDGIASGVNP